MTRLGGGKDTRRRKRKPGARSRTAPGSRAHQLRAGLLTGGVGPGVWHGSLLDWLDVVWWAAVVIGVAWWLYTWWRDQTGVNR